MKRIELETALLAKSKGLEDSFCKHRWGYQEEHTLYNPRNDEDILYEQSDPYVKNYSNGWNDNFITLASAPYQAELQEWLRKQNIFVEGQLDCTSYPKFAVEVFVFNGIIADFVKIEQKDWSLYRTYEEALEVGLIIGLKQIKI